MEFTKFSNEVSKESSLYEIDGESYSKDNIITLHRNMQSLHDKNKSLEFSKKDIQIKEIYKKIQSQRDSERINLLKKPINRKKIHVENIGKLKMCEFDGLEFSENDVIKIHKQIQSEHSKNKSLEFTPFELHMENWHKKIQSRRDSERVKKQKISNTTVDNVNKLETLVATYSVNDQQLTADQILAKCYAIQSLHTKDTSLEFTSDEIKIKQLGREIQSQRDSARIRMLHAKSDCEKIVSVSTMTTSDEVF